MKDFPSQSYSDDHDNFSKSNFKMSQKNDVMNSNASLKFNSNQNTNNFAKANPTSNSIFNKPNER